VLLMSHLLIVTIEELTVQLRSVGFVALHAAVWIWVEQVKCTLHSSYILKTITQN
jgi:hypothetical protein